MHNLEYDYIESNLLFQFLLYLFPAHVFKTISLFSAVYICMNVGPFTEA